MFLSEWPVLVRAPCFRCFSGTCQKWLFQQTTFYICFEQVLGFYISGQIPEMASISCRCGTSCCVDTWQTVFFFQSFHKTLSRLLMSFENDTKGQPFFFYPGCFMLTLASQQKVFSTIVSGYTTHSIQRGFFPFYLTILLLNCYISITLITTQILIHYTFPSGKEISTRVYENYKSPAKAAVESGSD